MTESTTRRGRKLAAPRGFEVLPSDGRRFMVLRLRSGRRVVQRTFTSSEVDFLVWMLAWVSWNSDEAKTPGQALLLAFERGRGISPVVSDAAEPLLYWVDPLTERAAATKSFVAGARLVTDESSRNGSQKGGAHE
ncbi:hypothetical protein ACJJWD_13830 [Comamonas testosteroni]|uniref:hypothetical protein n=1 Tax=Comamonas testosteroni TaxID=285 RepID=UPI00389A2690